MTEETDKRKKRLSNIFQKKEERTLTRKSHEDASPLKHSQFKLQDSKGKTLPLPSPTKEQFDFPKKRISLNSSFDTRTTLGASSSASSSTDFDGSEEVNVPEKRKLTTEETRNEIVHGWYTSEKNYVNNLSTVISKVLIPLRSVDVVPKDDIKAIFSSIETIHQISLKILDDVKIRLDTWFTNASNQMFADVFVKAIPFLKIYTTYIKDYKQAMEKLDIAFANPSFKTFLSKINIHMELREYLTQPMERLSIYETVFQELLVVTPTSHPDFQNISKSIEELSKLHDYIIEKQNEVSSINHVFNAQKRLSGKFENIIIPSRKLIKEGEVFEIVKGVSKKSFIFLFNDILILARAQNSFSLKGGQPKYTYKVRLELDKIINVDSTESERVVIHEATHILVLGFKSSEETEEWRKSLKQNVDEAVKRKSIFSENAKRVSETKSKAARALIKEHYASLRTRIKSKSVEIETLPDTSSVQIPESQLSVRLRSNTVYKMNSSEILQSAETAESNLNELSKIDKQVDQIATEKAQKAKKQIENQYSNYFAYTMRATIGASPKKHKRKSRSIGSEAQFQATLEPKPIKTSEKKLTKVKPTLSMSDPEIIKVMQEAANQNNNNNVKLLSPPKQVRDMLSVINDDRGYYHFLEYLKEEYATENLEFWKEIEVFKSLPSSELRSRAKDIYLAYIKPGVLNLPFVIKLELENKFEGNEEELVVEKSTFDKAQKSILDLLRFDNYPRFERSMHFRAYMDEMRKFLVSSPSKKL